MNYKKDKQQRKLKTKTTTIRNESEDITTDPTDSKNIF